MIIFSLCLNLTAFGGVGEWKSYTTKRTVRDICRDRNNNEIFWINTSGGFLKFHTATNTFNEFTTSEGLLTNNLTAINSGFSGEIWIGSQNGIVHKYIPSLDKWEYFTQIADDKAHGPGKTINDLEVSGDTLFILSDIGVSLISISDGIFIDNYLHSLVDEANSLVLYNGKIYVGTNEGIAYTSMLNPNPSAPDLWNRFTVSSGLPSNHINSLIIFQNTLLACTDNGIALLNDSTWNILPNTWGLNVIDIVIELSNAYFIDNYGLYRYSMGEPVSLIQSFSTQLSAIGSASLLGTEKNGLFLYDNDQWKNIITPGPPSNKFVGIAIDEKGIVWAGTGARNGEGFMSFDGKEWRLYTLSEFPEFRYNEFYKVSVGTENIKWISGWGSGIVKVDNEGVVREVYNTSNGIPPCIPADLSYAVVGGVAEDRSGTTWITSRTPPGDTILTLYNKNGSFEYLIGTIFGKTMRNPYNVFTDVLIDYNGTKWFANFSRFEPETPGGFYFYNENENLPGTISGWGKLTTADGLTSNKVWSLALDKEGGIWIGSDQGITIIFNPRNPAGSIAPYHPLRDQIIQAIVTDECDNKWIATKRGVFVLSPDGTSILEHYTVASTGGKLLDDDVNSIAINNKTGVVYMGTENGLSTLTTNVITPLVRYGEILISPNPFYIPESNTLTIDGLVQSSSIKIITISGKVVKEFQCPCSRIGFWDGKDEDGNYLSTGIYILVVYAENGNAVATGKLAVIRK